MSEFIKKSFSNPDDTAHFPGITVEIVQIGGIEVRRLTAEPEWVWSESVGPAAGIESCQFEHLVWFVISGQFVVQMDDGTTEQFGPGDIGVIPPGHDAWVSGDEPVVGLDIQADGIDASTLS